MSERYKLGLTRNRLFEFDNCVLFCGKFGADLSETELNKAFKMLCLKEPLITSRIELETDGTAFVVTESVEQNIKKAAKTSVEILSDYEINGVNFWESLFEFFLSSDGFLIIAAHTTVSDAKSLLRLAVEFSDFYNKPPVSVEPSKIKLFSETIELPIEVASPIIDKLSAELDSKWAKKTESFSVDDYKKAKDIYSKNIEARGELSQTITENELMRLAEYCKENNVDASSVVAFSFYETLIKFVGGDNKYNKMNIYADERFFFDDFNDYNVGAFNGVITADLTKKERTKSLDERVKQFHLDCYKGSTSPFRVFYDDLLLMKVSPSLCDSSYMYKSGLSKNKVSKKLAENYGCACEKICDFFSCNLAQMFWNGLDAYSQINVCEPFKMRSSTYLSFIRRKGEGYITFKYKKDKCSDLQAQTITKEAHQLLKNIIKSA